MSMTVTLFVNTSDVRCIDKDITPIGETRTCNLYEPSDMFNPILDIRYSDEILDANYVYIPKFKRYYYITLMELQPAHIVRIKCSCDVLMSFSDYIKSLTVTTLRNEFRVDAFIPDNKYRVKDKTTTHNYTFTGGGFPITSLTYNYVLSAIGGARGGENT